MGTNIRLQYLENIDALTKSTQDQKIKWFQQNQSTYYCNISSSTALIQKIIDFENAIKFFFELRDVGANSSFLKLDSTLGVDYNKKLADLYDTIEKFSDDKAINRFNDIIRTIQ